MWKAKCEYCGKDIEEKVPCYPVYRKDRTKGYRHLTCYEEAVEQPKDYIPFGQVTDTHGELD